MVIRNAVLSIGWLIEIVIAAIFVTASLSGYSLQRGKFRSILRYRYLPINNHQVNMNLLEVLKNYLLC